MALAHGRIANRVRVCPLRVDRESENLRVRRITATLVSKRLHGLSCVPGGFWAIAARLRQILEPPSSPRGTQGAIFGILLSVMQMACYRGGAVSLADIEKASRRNSAHTNEPVVGLMISYL